MRKNHTFPVALLAAVVAAFSVSVPVLAIRPVIIMFYGEPLQQPVFLVDTMVFHDLENPTTITAKELAGRPYLKVAMFWGPQRHPYVTGEKSIRSLTPEMASQHGWFYPATSVRPAVLLQTKPQIGRLPLPEDAASFTWGGVLDGSWIESLVARGVPARQGGQW